MQLRTTLFISTLFFTLFMTAAVFASTNCPLISQIKRVPGQYRWTATIPGWQGGYVSPTDGKGDSTKVLRFLQARWIQFSNLPNSPGYIQCDYIGDRWDEIIRFSQSHNKSTKRPHGYDWIAVNNVNFPSVQTSCERSAKDCVFDQL